MQTRQGKSRLGAWSTVAGLACMGVVVVAAGLGGCASDQRSAAQRGPGGARVTAPRTPRNDKERAAAAVDKASDLRQEGVDAAALAEFERAIELNPTLTVAYLGAGDIYRERGDYGLAEQRYGAAATLEPRNFDAQYNHGLVLQLLNRVAESVRAYLRALAIREDDFNANLNLATAYLQLGEPNQARPFAERAVRADAGSGPARVNLGAVYAAMGQHTAAVIEYQQAAELMTLTPELLLNLADSLGQVERYEEMAATLDQLIRLAPSAVAYERLGSARFRLKRYDEALAAFQRAAEMDPGHFPAWNGVGVCLLNRYLWSDKQDDPARQQAVEALRRSLRLEPGQTRIVELVRRYG